MRRPSGLNATLSEKAGAGPARRQRLPTGDGVPDLDHPVMCRLRRCAARPG